MSIYNFVVLCIFVFGTKNFFPFLHFFKNSGTFWGKKFTWKSHLGQPFFSQKQSANQPKKNTGECSTNKLKSTCKNSGTFEGKKNHLKKSFSSVLHQAIQLCTLHVFRHKQPNISFSYEKLQNCNLYLFYFEYFV